MNIKRCQSWVARVGTEGVAEGFYFGWQVIGVWLLVCRVLVVVLCIQHSPYSLRCVHLSTAHLGGVSLVLRHSDVMWLPPHLTHL